MASTPDPNRGSEVTAFSIVMIILPTITVVLRVWSRLTPKSQRFWWDDWFAIASLVCTARYPINHAVLNLLSRRKAVRACNAIHINAVGVGRAWSSFQSTFPGANGPGSQVRLRN